MTEKEKKMNSGLKFDNWLKANRRGSREAELLNEKGWKTKNKIHKNKKKYDRKREKRKII